MKTKNMIAIATLTMAFTGTVLAQWHPEIDKVKARAKAQPIQSPRPVSGQATQNNNARNRRPAGQNKLGNFEIQDLKAPRNTQDKLGNFEIQDIKSPRDSQTGQATGRRMHKPRRPNASQDKLGNFEIQSINSPRDAASGQATGITSPRDAASGLPTGKRQHKPFRQALVNNEVIKDANMQQLQPGNSGGTITNQRSRRPNRRK